MMCMRTQAQYSQCIHLAAVLEGPQPFHPSPVAAGTRRKARAAAPLELRLPLKADRRDVRHGRRELLLNGPPTPLKKWPTNLQRPAGAVTEPAGRWL
jgi:hypothetical protein